MDSNHQILSRHLPLLQIPDGPPQRFGSVRLMPFALISNYKPFSNFQVNPQSLPSISDPVSRLLSDSQAAQRLRGAPIKLKNTLVQYYNLKNTKGSKFKFSFVLQILIAHIQHLFGLKGKSRYQTKLWLRSNRREGQAIIRDIKNLIGKNTHIIQFKRTVSMKDLKKWIRADQYCQGDENPQDVAALRYEVFRKICILKCIDLQQLYQVDFNVISGHEQGWMAIYEYLTKIMWEEMGFEKISSEEQDLVISTARARQVYQSNHSDSLEIRG